MSTNNMATLAEAFQIAVSHHQAGRLDDSRDVCEKILAVRPQHPDTLFLMGTISIQKSEFAAAVDTLERAIAAQPSNDMFRVRLALALRLGNRLEEAVAMLRTVLERQPDLLEAMNLHADIAAQQGQWNEAELLYRRVLQRSPENALVHNALGIVLQSLKKYDLAVDSYQKALALMPMADTANNLANVYVSCGDSTVALELYERAIAMRPDFASAHYNRANALRDLNHVSAAAMAYRRTLELCPSLWQAACNLGLLLQDTGEVDEAERLFRAAVAQQPNEADPWNNLGALLMQRGQCDQALVTLRQAIAIRPRFAAAWNNLGNLHKSLGQESDSLECYRQAIDIEPNLTGALINLSGLLKSQGDLDGAEQFARQALISTPDSALAYDALGNALIYQGRIYEAIDAYLSSMQINANDPRAHSNYLFALQYRPGVTLEELKNAHSQWNDAHVGHIVRADRWPMIDINPDRPLNIGLVSADLCYHPIGHLLKRFLGCVDRGQGRLFAYSDRVTHDALTLQLRNSCDKWCDSATLNDEQLAQQIERDRIDVLLDLSGHTGGNRLTMFARKPAPLQASWLGYVGSTGVDAIDFVIADDNLVPDHLVSQYRERVIRLPISSCCYEVPVTAPAVGPLPAQSHGRITFGSFNNFAKVTPQVIETWGKILKRVPSSRLLMKFRGGQCSSVQRYFRDLFEKCGADQERINIQGASPFGEMLELYNTTIDIGLDPFPYTGGTTTILASYMGVPTITLPGETLASRQSFAVLKALGVEETIVQNLDEYIERAVELSHDQVRLALLRSMLRPRFLESPLANAELLTRNLLASLRAVWREWCEKQADASDR
ncbi:MAG: tetratricopeptide repeat protein [Planctomycetaceae bacterium]|nr:tetratricopeptide repeat protein [Planctomycetaceae bacterium]